MADKRPALTDKMILNLPYAEDGQYRVRDADLPGFFVLVGKRRKSFMAQGEFWRDGIREFAVQVKLGEFGEITTREARSNKGRTRIDRAGAEARRGVGNRAAWQRESDSSDYPLDLGLFTVRRAAG